MIDFEINVKYICKNICEEKDLENKTPYEIYKILSDDFYFDFSMFSDQYKIESINILKTDIKNKKDILK